MSLSYFEVKSFVGESFGSDPVKDAVKSATTKAQNYIDCTEVKQVTSTTTQLAFHGDYVSYVITMVIETAVEDDEEAN